MSVVDKVVKLLALASEDGGGTEAERNLAAEKAQALMLEHRIDQAALENARGREALPGIERVRLGKFTQRDYWKYDLYYALGEQVGVDAIYTGDLGSKRVSLVGRPDSIEYVQALADWLIPQLSLECEKALLEAKEEPDSRWEQWRAYGAGAVSSLTMDFRRSFYEAAVAKIRDRLSMAAREKGELGMALVRSDQAAKDEFYGDSKPEVREIDTYTGRGTVSGLEAGDRADINPASRVEGGSRKELGS